MQIIRFLRRISSWSAIRLTWFVLLVIWAQKVPHWARGPLWLLAFCAGIWTFLALRRESRKALDYLVPAMQRAASGLGLSSRLPSISKLVGLLCAVTVAILALYRAGPIWSFKATSSLREDEIMSVARYSAKGFVPAISTYHLARNHVFFNVVNSLIPGADSTMPIRARLLSFVSVLAALAIFVAYGGKRGWLLPGLACAGLLAGNFPAMDTALEARGYGFILLFAMLGSLAFTEWIRTSSPAWITVMAVSCVLGTYTLPFYIVFGGGLLFLSFLFRPSRKTFLAGFLSVVAILMLYLPILTKIYSVFGGYAERYKTTFFSSFQSIDGVFFALQYFFPREVIEIGALSFLLLAAGALLYVAFGRFAEKSDRISFAGLAVSVLAFLAFCLYCRIVPLRVASYLAAPLAFLALLIIGPVLASRWLAPVRPCGEVLFTLLTAAVMLKSEVVQPLVPRADWRDLGVLIERAFPKDTRIWLAGESPALLQWNLSSRAKPENGPLDREALREGKLVAVEAYTKPSDEGRRFRWQDLPEGVRFVTSPISLNYHRTFFVPPWRSGIASIVVNDQKVETRIAGRQPSDPDLFSHSFGHGDVLRPKNAGEASEAKFAKPSEIRLPATVTVEFEPGVPRGTCNLLFSQGLQDKRIHATIRSRGDWRKTSNVFVLGELASIGLDRPDCESVRVIIEGNPSEIPQAERPTFGLLDAWIAPGQLRLP